MDPKKTCSTSTSMIIMIFDAMDKTSQNMVLYHMDYYDYCHPSRIDNPYNSYINRLTMKHMVKNWSKQFTVLTEAPICKPNPQKKSSSLPFVMPISNWQKQHLSPSSMPCVFTLHPFWYVVFHGSPKSKVLLLAKDSTVYKPSLQTRHRHMRSWSLSRQLSKSPKMSMSFPFALKSQWPSQELT